MSWVDPFERKDGIYKMAFTSILRRVRIEGKISVHGNPQYVLTLYYGVEMVKSN
jgi:hypothetical protein